MNQKPSRKTFRQRLQDMVLQIRQDIESGELCAGEYLPSENALADSYLLSKNSVRKGLDILVGEGFIEKVPRVGNRVCDRPTGNQTVLNFYYYIPMKKDVLLEQIIEAFHKDHPEIRVKSCPMPYEFYSEAINEHMNNEMLDVLAILSGHFGLFESSHVSDLLMPFEIDPQIYPFLGSAFKVGSEIHAKPFYFAPVVLCYNREHFREAGVLEPDSSWRWQDALRAAKALGKANERMGLYFHLLSTNRWPIFLLQSGSAFQRDGDGSYSIVDTPLMEAFQLGRDLIHEQNDSPIYMSENDQDPQELFLQGKVSMILTTYTGLNHLRDTNLDFDIAPLPYLHTPATLLQYIGLAVNRKSKNTEAARIFVDYLTSAKVQMFIRKHSMSIPAMKRAAEWMGEDQLKNRPHRFHMFREIIPTFRLHKDLNLSVQQIEKIGQEMKLFWSRMEDLETVCRRLEELL